MEDNELQVGESELKESILDETNEIIIKNKSIVSKLFGDTNILTSEMREESINRLYNDDYEFKGVTSKKLKEKIDSARRVDAAITLRHMIFDFDALSARYLKSLMWYHIGVLRAYLFCTDPEKPYTELPQNLLNLKPSPSPEIKNVVLEAEPEIDEIYSSVKKVGFSGRLVKGPEKWREAALERYDDSSHGFNLIIREYLEDMDLYEFASGQERRDFYGRLLNKIIRGRGLENYGAQRLYRLLKNKKTDTD
jgi:hypothetical protein